MKLLPIAPGRLGGALVGAGLALAALALLADRIGLGRRTGFGEHQWMLLCAGAILFMLGFAIVISVWPGNKGG